MNPENEADLQTLELENAGRIYYRLKRKGICLHWSLTAPNGGPCVCNECGKQWPTLAHCDEERDELKAMYF